MDNKKRVLITGASSGIGLELAKIFAKNSFDLVVVARSKNKLEELKLNLEKEFKISVLVIDQDLADPTSPKALFDKLKNQKIDILVNNAGFGDFGMFHKLSWEKSKEMIQVNITALTELTHLFLNEFIKHKSGKILNVASTAAFQPGPLMAVYYATKAYVLHFSEAISEELKNTGVTVTALCPGPTTSGFQKAASIENTKLVKGRNLPTSKEVAEYGYKALMEGQTVAIHGLFNKVGVGMVRLSPRGIVRRLVKKIQENVKQ